MCQMLKTVHQINHHLLLLQLDSRPQKPDEDEIFSDWWVLVTIDGKFMPLPALLEQYLLSEPQWYAVSSNSSNDQISLKLYTKEGDRITRLVEL